MKAAILWPWRNKNEDKIQSLPMVDEKQWKRLHSYGNIEQQIIASNRTYNCSKQFQKFLVRKIHLYVFKQLLVKYSVSYS